MPSLFDVTAGKAIGYVDGGTVTQATNKSTAVTLNTLSGQITMNDAALAAAAEVSFTLTNSKIAATDVVIVNHSSAGTAGSYLAQANTLAAGSFRKAKTQTQAKSKKNRGRKWQSVLMQL